MKELLVASVRSTPLPSALCPLPSVRPPLPAPDSSPLFELENVPVYRGETRAPDHLSLTLQPGEHVAILGPNGCGKSTLIKTLTRECYPATGEGPFSVRVMGRDRWDTASLRSLLGIVTNDL